jgi:hypothetical protein
MAFAVNDPKKLSDLFKHKPAAEPQQAGKKWWKKDG